MAPDKQKVKLCAALLTGIMIPLISRRGFQRAHALLDQPAVLAVGRDDPALAALANDQARTGVAGPQLVDFERLSLSRSVEHTSEHQSLMPISYAVFFLKKKRPLRDRTRHLLISHK